MAELVINWTIHQPGITAAVCGAKRPEQIRETAGGSGWKLTDEQLAPKSQVRPKCTNGKRSAPFVHEERLEP